MSKFIDIVVAIDTVSLLKSVSPSQDYRAPKAIDHTTYSYAIAQKSVVESGLATGDLAIRAVVGDIIRWRALSLSGNTSDAAIIFGVPRFAGDDVTGKVTASVAQPLEPLPVVTDGGNTTPPSFKAVVENDYFLQTTVERYGKEQYKVQFYVTRADENTGLPVLVGYYEWDPVINVPKPV